MSVTGLLRSNGVICFRWERGGTYVLLVETYEGKTTLSRHRRQSEDDIKKDLIDIG